MQSLQFKMFIFLTFFSSNVMSFSSVNCMKSDFIVNISHKGWPFGLTNNILNINKSGCEIKIKHQRLKYISQSWHIDVCREPVHIKKGSGPIEVLKKVVTCRDKEEDSFCNEYKRLKETIQDDGLIFASGEKNTVESDHGKVYCAYQLLNVYLSAGQVLNIGEGFKIYTSSFVDKRDKNSSDDVPRPEIEGSTNEKILEIDEEDKSSSSSSSSRSF